MDFCKGCDFMLYGVRLLHGVALVIDIVKEDVDDDDVVDDGFTENV